MIINMVEKLESEANTRRANTFRYQNASTFKQATDEKRVKMECTP